MRINIYDAVVGAKEGIKRALSVPGNQAVVTKEGEKGRFHLWHGALKIGTLSLCGGIWEFEYTPEFKEQVYEGIKPLMGFPDVDKIYEAKELWPSFAVRIPSLEQPSVKEIITDENIDEQSAVQLLRRFGEETISNPFRLTSQDASC